MSVTRWPWADHLDRKEWGEVGRIEGEINYLQRRGSVCAIEKFARLTEIDSLKLQRQRLVNRGTARARLAAKRTKPPRVYRRQA
jgi:hypothetical protein